MKQQLFTFTSMNTDLSDKAMPAGSYRLMKNCRPNNKNTGSGGVVSSIKSSLKITAPAFGEDVVFQGSCRYDKQSSIIAFYHGVTKDFITRYDTKTKTEAIVLQCTSSNGALNLTGKITHAAVMDDTLFFIDSAFKMRKLDVVDAETDTSLDRFSHSDLIIDRFPPLYPPNTSATSDNSFPGNNIDNTIFQFAYAFEYDDKTVSSWSPFSKSVMPASASDEDIVFPNNAIDVTVNTGTSRVTKIYIAYRKGESGNFAIAEKLDKTELSIGDNTTYTYRFYNNKYSESIGDDQSSVITNTANPFINAKTLALSKDNFVIYGLVNDSLDKPDVTLTLTASGATIAARTASYKHGATHKFGVVFRDENGRSDGVNAVTEVYIPFYTDADYRGLYSNTNTRFNIGWEVTGTIPLWAKTMSIVYMGNVTLSSFVQYAISDIEDVGDYTYIDISSLNKFKDNVSVLEPGKQNSILSAYTFQKGDRIRFISQSNGTLLTSSYDYEVLGYVTPITDSDGDIYYENTIYVNKFGWSGLSINTGARFEIYTPRKEYVDDLYYEIGEVIEVASGALGANTGTLTTGDSYCFQREIQYYEVGELVSDRDLGRKDGEYNYSGDYGIAPKLNVVKKAEGIQPQAFVTDNQGVAFYKNSTGEQRTIVVSGKYDITSETDNGYTFKIRRMNSSDALVQDYTITTVPNTTGSQSRVFNRSGNISNTITMNNGEYVFFYFDIPDKSNIFLEKPVKIDVSVRIYDPSTGASEVVYIESKNYSDYFVSDEHSLGRPYAEIKTKKGTYKNNIVATGKYFADTDINDTNKISSIPSGYVPYAFGLISAMRVKGDTLKVFTPNKEISFYLGKEEYATGSGERQFALSTADIGSMRVYDSDYGTENPESLMEDANSIYYYDRKNACVVRTSNNGQTPIDEYGFKTELRQITELINASSAYNVYIGYNDKNEEVIMTFVVDGADYSLVFNERDNIKTHNLDLVDASHNAIQGMSHYGENLLYWVQGNAYLMEQGSDYGKFADDYKEKTIKFVFNDSPINTKILHSMALQSNKAWSVSVLTEPITPYEHGMYTLINKVRFQKKEGIWFTDIPFNLYDKNGNIRFGGYANGETLRGRTANITMTEDSTTEVLVDSCTIMYEDSTIQ